VTFSHGVGTHSDDVATFKITILWRKRNFFAPIAFMMDYEDNFGLILETPIDVFKGIMNINHIFFYYLRETWF
jgi:hypothetical protein